VSCDHNCFQDSIGLIRNPELPAYDVACSRDDRMTMTKCFALAAILMGCGFLALAAANSHRYSAIGLDTDRLRDEQIVHSYWRLRWVGDGTIRCGGGEKRYRLDEETLDTIDLAGRLMEEPQLEMHRSARWGFGLWQGPEAYDSREGTHRWARWISVPAWLPGIVMLGIGGILYQYITRYQRAA
jgi:hypothetical protein